MEKLFKLNISPDGSESLRIGDGAAKEIPKFFLTSTLLKAAKDYKLTPFSTNYKDCLEKFYLNTIHEKYILDDPAPTKVILSPILTPESEELYIVPEEDESKIYPWLKETSIVMDYSVEITQLYNYVAYVLSPEAVRKDEQSSIKALLSPDLNTFQKKLATSILIYRCKQLHTYPEYFNNQLVRTYESTVGLFPLCWAEIWNAIENKIMAGVCPYCWSVYKIKSKGTIKKICGSEECKYLRQIENNGTKRTTKGTQEKPGRPLGEDAKAARDLYKEGIRIEGICSRLHTSESKILRYLEPILKKPVIDLFVNDDLQRQEIANELGIKLKMVDRILRKAGYI